VLAPDGRAVGEVGEGNRKDIRNAVAAAVAGRGWARATAHARAQILYYIAENLAARGDELARRLDDMTGGSSGAAEVEASIARLFTYGAWADKYDGAVHPVPIRGVALAMHEPVGVIGIACPDAHPLLGFVSLVAPAIAMGNRVVAVPSEPHPLAATDFYQVLETSDLPAEWSTSSPARATRWRGCSPSTTRWTRCGTSARARGWRWSSAPRRRT
jgi:aldehyde dehydrogenase (NAD+)